MKRKTKIIATIGPASLKYNIFKEIVRQGADFIRINTAYSNSRQHALLAENIKRVSSIKKVELIFDIRAPKFVKDILIYQPDIIALSFAESVSQFSQLQKVLPESKIIAKVESKKGVENFEQILKLAWGMMVARGDLGQAVSLEKVPCLQKRFSKKTLAQGKFLIIATEMLLSMTKKSQPTRAEASDVANAVFDGASALMLSEETAIGKHPVEVVRYMRKIIEEAENCI